MAGPPLGRYLTFVATVVFVPYEIHELTKSVTALKVLTLVINLAIVVYLLVSKRLFGLRGGGRAERAEYAADVGWPASSARLLSRSRLPLKLPRRQAVRRYRAVPRHLAGLPPRAARDAGRHHRGVLHVDVEFPAAGQQHTQRI